MSDATISARHNTHAQLNDQPHATPLSGSPSGNKRNKREPSRDRLSETFGDLTLSSHAALQQCQRVLCEGGCGRRRRYYCGECVRWLVPRGVTCPRVKLPLFVDILQAGGEGVQRSTAQHVALLGAGSARVWRPFPECRDQFEREVLGSGEGCVGVLYPGEGAMTPEEARRKLPGLERIVVVDSNWAKSVLLMRESCLSGLPRLTLPVGGGGTRFWRYAPKRGEHSEHFSPDKVGSLLSTVECVHRFCDVYNVARGGKKGEMDDLMWLFSFLHGRVKKVYEDAPGKRQRIMRKSKGLLSQF